ncbi:efflux RND transporter periplasmic adaptor subunit [Brevibacillus brevis]|uniref:efflux RND transporter periplasmic adaptor subunit n=1 Tax=Brevibacillus brevis TaxID=1393 RepID=UPI000D0F05F5|nr:efflux RND transporter periplasmic adaptor subunit [Brevibacillus brevis]PSJ71303.1 efflux RND transporter periplasmic adaptor subunit [Brevibacillus brevis]RED28908.1 RND family efflux transporter MFP subunit [Brevibacillus brevis]GEC90281.1 RND transporter [Brevibacillus brevis]VEF91497.1 Macrolide-specific efflux protein macA precursor [Brevibacillus brevis]
MIINKRIAIVALLSLTLITGCASQEDAATTAAPPEETVTPVQVATVAQGVVTSESGLTAKLAPSEEVQMSPKTSGKIKSLPVKLGQPVTKGQLLFTLDTNELSNSVREQEAALRVAKANLTQAGSTSDQGLVEAQNDLTEAERALADAKLNQQRNQQLFAQGAIAAEKMEEANTTLTKAQISYDNAKQKLQSAKQKTGVQVSAASVTESEVRLQNAREQLANATVVSPIDGFVASVTGAVGQMAGQQPIVTVVKTNPLVVKANLSEADVTKVKVGAGVKVNVQSTGKTIDAKVTAISPVMDSQLKAYPVEITIPNASNELKSDMVVNVTFPQGSEGAKSLVIPRKAVFEREGRQYVFKLEGETAKQVEVSTGNSTSELIEVVSGLANGDKVVVKGQTLLADGGKVSIQE